LFSDILREWVSSKISEGIPFKRVDSGQDMSPDFSLIRTRDAGAAQSRSITCATGNISGVYRGGMRVPHGMYGVVSRSKDQII
jgi:hypothetical protein